MAETQQDRRLQLTTPLGEDVLMITSFTGDEEISRSFSYELELASTDGKIAFNDIIGQSVTVMVDAEDTGKRYFNGFVSEFTQIEDADQLARYRAKVVPWLWFLTRVSDCRIFQEKTIPEIIEEVFNSRHFNQYELRLTGSYPPLENCVQYRETDFNFVSRLMEQEGICYFFIHKDGGHTLVLADSPSAHEPCPNCETVNYSPWDSGQNFSGIRSWTREARVCPGAFAHTDFDFKSPGKKLLADASDPKQHDHADYEIYDYPGEYVERSAGDNYSTIRIQELQSRHHVLRGEADIAGLLVGHNVTLAEAYRDEDNRKYLIFRIHHEIHSNPFGSQGGSGQRFYHCRFSMIPASVEFRPERQTPKPLITGPQTAIVTGPAGDEIHTDQYARVKVHFHWHRHDKRDDKSSCWTRVSQHWAGKQWGAIHIPRIGQEVIVEFLDGDPDRPIITGRVYNGENPPPYDLPANKTQSGIKSRSTTGGSTSNFNELRFEDKKGSEEVFLHAEKDWTIKVKNNEGETVGSNISTSAGGNISRNAGANISRTADVTITDMAGKDIITKSGKNMELEAGGSYQLFTSLGIHLKAMNFVAALIESGAKAAAAALTKGGAQTAVETAAGGGSGSAASGAQNTGMSALAALSPGIEAGAAELTSLSNQTGENLSGVETAGGAAGKAASEFNSALESGASPAVIAGAFMAMASAAAEAWDSAKKVVEGLLPQIPSIELWAMKDINAHALWSMSLSTKVKDICIEAQNKDINVKAKQNINLEAETKDINIKASAKNVSITGKEQVNVVAEDNNLVIEAKKKKVFVKSADQIFLKCGSASISMSKSGNIVIKGAKININGSGPVTIKGTPIKLN